MGGYAWVTLATNDSYSLGALVLANSLRQVGTQQQLAVLVTPGVTNSMRDKLRQVFDLVQEVNILDSRDEANLRLLKRPELGITFTKLHCWRLTQFDKCVFLDADTLVLENCDELFEREELSAAPDVGWPDCFNSGVFVYRPSNETYEKLIQFALEKGSFDGGDQGLLNLFFSDWAHKDISKHLPFIYNLCSTAGYSYLPAFKQFGGNAKIIHFIGATKPWLQFFDTESRRVHPSGDSQHLQDVLQHWWNIFCSLIHPNLTADMTSSHTDTVHGSQPYIPPQNIPPTRYVTYQHHIPVPDIPNPAEDYQNVWDPWEEYDFRQSQNQPNQSETIYETSSHSYRSEEQDNREYHFHTFQHHTQSHDDQNRWVEEPIKPPETREQPNDQSLNIPEIHSHIQYETQSHPVQNSQQNLVESHNTTACFAGHHDSSDYQQKADSHHFHPPPPTYSQPQPPTPQPQPQPVSEPAPQIFTPHQEPPPPTPHTRTIEPPSIETPPPRLPDECVATAKVSDDFTLNIGTNEATNDNSSGLAGAFAQLTLGIPRTAEQTALDDHLRRQGWEVGNIDYLGRDSFDNIWSKICETLSSAPEPTPKPKDPSPPTTSDVTTPEQPPVEVITKAQPTQETPEQLTSQPEPVAEVTAPPVAAPEVDTTIQLVPQPEEATPTTVAAEEPTVALQSLVSTETPIHTSKPAEVVPPTSQLSESSQSAPVVPEIPQPTPVASESPQPAAEVPASPQPVAETPMSSESAPEVPASPPVTSEAPPTAQPTPEVPASPQTTPEVPASPQPTPEVPASVQIAPEVPASPQAAPEVPASPQPASEAPSTPQPAAEVTPSPQPTTEASPTLQPALETPVSSTPAAEVPTSPQPAPEVPASPQTPPEVPVSSLPAAEVSSPQPAAPAAATPEASPTVPESQPAATLTESPQPPPVSAPTPESPKVTPVVPEIPTPAPVPESPQPTAATESASATPVVTKPATAKAGTEKKASSKKSKETPQVQLGEATSAVTPASPSTKQPKQALVVDTNIVETPPPSTEGAAATPTPPPRKSGAPKKTSTKPKK